MITLIKKNIKPINFVDALYCELVNDDGDVVASFKALNWPNHIQAINRTIKKSVEINIEEYIN